MRSFPKENNFKYGRQSQSNIFNNVELKSKHNEKVSAFLNVNGWIDMVGDCGLCSDDT